MTVNGTELTKEKGGADMKKTATISAILAVVGFMAVYVALCYLVPGWRLKLHATAWAYFAASLRHMALLKGVFVSCALQGVKKKSSPRRDCCLAVFWCGGRNIMG